jgi:hypothetical protein
MSWSRVKSNKASAQNLIAMLKYKRIKFKNETRLKIFFSNQFVFQTVLLRWDIPYPQEINSLSSI